jgi:phosphoglycerate kinase
MIAFVRKLRSFAAALPIGGVLLLENVRFYEKQEKNDTEFC